MLDNNPALTATSFVKADANAVKTALAAAHDFAGRAGCDETMCVRLAIIVEELVSNVVEHGQCAAGSCIKITVSTSEKSVSLSLCDSGIEFDPRTAPAPDIPPERGGGAGVAMVLAWSREVTWERRGGRNHLRLVIAPDE